MLDRDTDKASVAEAVRFLAANLEAAAAAGRKELKPP